MAPSSSMEHDHSRMHGVRGPALRSRSMGSMHQVGKRHKGGHGILLHGLVSHTTTCSVFEFVRQSASGLASTGDVADSSNVSLFLYISHPNASHRRCVNRKGQAGSWARLYMDGNACHFGLGRCHEVKDDTLSGRWASKECSQKPGRKRRPTQWRRRQRKKSSSGKETCEVGRGSTGKIRKVQVASGLGPL